MTAPMNKKLQIRNAELHLIGYGLDPDDYDLDAYFGSDLHYDENLKRFEREFKISAGYEKLLDKWEIQRDQFEDSDYDDSDPYAPEPEPIPGPVYEHYTGLKIWCYRDSLDADNDDFDEDEQEELDGDEFNGTELKGKDSRARPDFGCTLYFIRGSQKRVIPGVSGISKIFTIIQAIAGHVNQEKSFEVGTAIEKLILNKNPIIGFVEMCIHTGINKTACYTQAKAAKIAIRKQTQLALYEYLKLSQNLCNSDPDILQGESIDNDYFERVQQFFIEQFQEDDFFSSYAYRTSELSNCPLSEITITGTDNLQHGDFIFEIGEKGSMKLIYYGTWINGRLAIRIFPVFDKNGLKKVLKS